MHIDELPVEKRIPPSVVVLVVIPMVLVVILVVIATAVAPSGVVLMEWILSTTVVGGLAWVASMYAGGSPIVRIGIGGAAAIGSPCLPCGGSVLT